MKILSVRQPYAWLIVSGLKSIENRTWTTKYRGAVLIHASGRLPGRELEEIESVAAQKIRRDQLFLGGVVGIATLVDVVQAHSSPYFTGPFGFVFEQARAVPFIPIKGRLGLVEAPPEIAAHFCGSSI